MMINQHSISPYARDTQNKPVDRRQGRLDTLRVREHVAELDIFSKNTREHSGRDS